MKNFYFTFLFLSFCLSLHSISQTIMELAQAGRLKNTFRNGFLNLADKKITSLENFAEALKILNINQLNVRVLDLGENLLQTLPVNVFSSFHNLKKLSLDHNLLKQLPRGIFDALREVEELNLENNDLSQLPENIFDPLNNLKKLWLKGNLFKSMQKMKPRIYKCLQNPGSLKKISVEQNFIEIQSQDSGLHQLEQALISLSASLSSLAQTLSKK